MRQVKRYRDKKAYLEDKKPMHDQGWRTIHHNANFVIEWIKGNEPENIVPANRQMTETEYVRQKALKDSVDII